MARYEIPPDPRDPNQKRPRRMRRDSPDPIPWKYLGMGLVVTVVGIVIALAIVRALLARPPLNISPVEPTIIVLTAPPSPVPSPTPNIATPTPIPTFTPVPTPDTAVAPPEVTVGYYAIVANTDGIGVSVRGGPSTSNTLITVADEGAIVLILDGPESANTFLWWQVRLEDGTEGWVAGQFLEPAAKP
ncbi:MAG: SH3 domain-containing protein [Chloroflexi bacterium]|nr:SH3 domain-containing protein [Chloroflexota bacterium]